MYERTIAFWLAGGCSTFIFSAASAEEIGARWLSVVPTSAISEMAKSSYISLTFDDATLSQYEAAFKILAQEGIPATLYVNTGAIDRQDPYFMSWDNVREMAAKGWEIGGHTVSHLELPTLTPLEIFGELGFSNYRLQAELGQAPLSFASPYGEYNEEVLKYIDYFYESHVRAWGDNEGVNPIDVNPLLIERVNVDGSLTEQDVCRRIHSMGGNQWMVLMFHQIGEMPGPFVSTHQQLEEIAKCVSESVQENLLVVDTVSAVVKKIQKREK